MQHVNSNEFLLKPSRTNHHLRDVHVHSTEKKLWEQPKFLLSIQKEHQKFVQCFGHMLLPDFTKTTYLCHTFLISSNNANSKNSRGLSDLCVWLTAGTKYHNTTKLGHTKCLDILQSFDTRSAPVLFACLCSRKEINMILLLVLTLATHSWLDRESDVQGSASSTRLHIFYFAKFPVA